MDFQIQGTSMTAIVPVEREGVREKVIDRLLLLHLYDKVSESNRITGDVKLQKLAFLSEKSMIERNAKGFHYKFFRWEHGPMSKEVYQDREFLEDTGLVSDYTGKINKFGRSILAEAEEVLESNSEFIADIDGVVEEYGHYTGGALKNVVYDVEVQPLTNDRSIRVEDIPPTTDIYFPLPDELVENGFDISEGWIRTLNILMDERASDSLNQALKNAKQSEGREFSFSHIVDEGRSEHNRVDSVNARSSGD